jgi:heat-inducible transcriptional repressor
LLVVVTAESLVRQSMLHLEEPATQDDLRAVTDTLLPHVRGASSAEMDGRTTGVTGTARLVLGHLVDTLRDLDAAERTEVRHDGLEHIVGQRGIEESDAQRVIAMLNGGAFLNAVLPRLSDRPEIQVFIGDDTLPEELRRFGLVIATYGVDGSVTGLLGVLGPTRMSYLRTVSTVRYMAGLMSDLMSNLLRDDV